MKKAEKVRADQLTEKHLRRIRTKLGAIANRRLGIPTLDTRNSDSLDFHDVCIWGLRDSMIDAFRLGFDMGWDASTQVSKLLEK